MYGQFFILFAMIVVGYYGYRKGWLTREVNKGLGGLVMQATIPAMLVTTIANIEITNDILVGFFLMMAAQAAAMMIFGFLMRLYGKARKLDGRLLDMLDITTGSLNNGFIGLPVAAIFFGDVGVMYMSAWRFGAESVSVELWCLCPWRQTGRQRRTDGENIPQRCCEPQLYCHFPWSGADIEPYGAVCATGASGLPDTVRVPFYTSFPHLHRCTGWQ